MNAVDRHAAGVRQTFSTPFCSILRVMVLRKITQCTTAPITLCLYIKLCFCKVKIKLASKILTVNHDFIKHRNMKIINVKIRARIKTDNTTRIW